MKLVLLEALGLQALVASTYSDFLPAPTSPPRREWDLGASDAIEYVTQLLLTYPVIVLVVISIALWASAVVLGLFVQSRALQMLLLPFAAAALGAVLVVGLLALAPVVAALIGVAFIILILIVGAPH